MGYEYDKEDLEILAAAKKLNKNVSNILSEESQNSLPDKVNYYSKEDYEIIQYAKKIRPPISNEGPEEGYTNIEGD